MELVNYFFEIMEARFNKPLPTLVNTDGELIQFSTSHFKLTMAPEEALHRLVSLTLSDDPEEFLQDAERNKSGIIKRIEFPWLKKGNKQHNHWDNTVMGQITVEQGRLILETNSEKRTQRGKKLLSQHLGEAIQFQQTLIETPEQKMKSLPKSIEKNSTDEDLLQWPEVQEQMKVMLKAHWNSWFDKPIPALDDKSPREAAKTSDGKEKLEALLLQYERHDLERSDNDPGKADIHYLRTELALD